MIGTVRETIARHSMLRQGCCVAVGLSGGADSVSLLHALLKLKAELGITLRAVHVNHGIRGDSAARDEQFCRELCSRLDVPLDCFSPDVPALASQRGIGLEECGRQCRYEAFERIARAHGCIIATAHTLSDSAETVIFNLARGSALGGVSGIPPVRTIADGVTVIRPLIGVTREEVERYCRDHCLDFVTDESNADTVYRRNLIRHEVIPALLQVNPALHSAVERFSRCAAEDDAYLEHLAVQAVENARIDAPHTVGWSTRAIAALPSPILRRAIICIARAHGCTPEYVHTELCADAVRRGSGAVMLSAGLRLSVRDGVLSADSGEAPAPVEPWQTVLAFPITVLPDGRRLFLRRVELDDDFVTQKHQKLLFKNALSCGIIKDNISVRNRREGDRFAQAGRGVTKKLKKLLCDEGIPVSRRDTLAILDSPSGILWIEGLGASELLRPAADDRCVLVPELSGKEKII